MQKDGRQKSRNHIQRSDQYVISNDREHQVDDESRQADYGESSEDPAAAPLPPIEEHQNGESKRTKRVGNQRDQVECLIQGTFSTGLPVTLWSASRTGR